MLDPRSMNGKEYAQAAGLTVEESNHFHSIVCLTILGYGDALRNYLNQYQLTIESTPYLLAQEYIDSGMAEHIKAPLTFAHQRGLDILETSIYMGILTIILSDGGTPQQMQEYLQLVGIGLDSKICQTAQDYCKSILAK